MSLIFLGILREENEQRNKYKQQYLDTQKQNKSTPLSLSVQSQPTNQEQVKSKSNKRTSKSNNKLTKRKTATNDINHDRSLLLPKNISLD